MVSRGYRRIVLSSFVKKSFFAFFFCLLLSFFALMLFVYRSYILASNTTNIDIVLNNLPALSLYAKLFDKELAQVLYRVYRLKQVYAEGGNIFASSDDLELVARYLEQFVQTRQQGFFFLDKETMKMVADFLPYREYFYELLGSKEPKHYLIALQNSAEKRPNGGFFGSFAFVSVVNGRIDTLRVIDSYFPNWLAPDVFLPAPSWTTAIIPDKRIGFIAANKYGFTDMDGANILSLFSKIFADPSVYQKSDTVIDQSLIPLIFGKKIDGVIFVQSDTIAKILPGIQQKLREWQFINANTDAIKKLSEGSGSLDFSNKKEQYLDDVTNYFTSNAPPLFKGFFRNLSDILSDGGVGIYLDPVSYDNDQQFSVLFDKYLLRTQYTSGCIYVRDTNDSNNKVDTFVKKNIILTDENGEKIVQSSSDVVCPGLLRPGTYELRIRYGLIIPSWYRETMLQYEKIYNVAMSPKERGILALEPTYDYVSGDPRWRSTRSQIYLPPSSEILDFVGDFRMVEQFRSPFAQGLFFRAMIDTEGKEIGVRARFRIP